MLHACEKPISKKQEKRAFRRPSCESVTTLDRRAASFRSGRHPCRIMDCRLISLLLLLSCMSLNALAFPQSRRRAILRTSTSRRGRCFHHARAVSVHRTCILHQTNSEDEDEYPFDRRRQSPTRRSMMLKSLGVVVVSTTADANPRTNAIDLPNFLVTDTATAPETRVNNGMPVPTKRAGGLSNKIRNVIKIMDELQRDMMLNKWVS